MAVFALISAAAVVNAGDASAVTPTFNGTVAANGAVQQTYGFSVSSPGRVTTAEARPWRTALPRERSLPSVVRGPQHFFALARLAASCRGVTVFVRRVVSGSISIFRIAGGCREAVGSEGSDWSVSG